MTVDGSYMAWARPTRRVHLALSAGMTVTGVVLILAGACGGPGAVQQAPTLKRTADSVVSVVPPAPLVQFAPPAAAPPSASTKPSQAAKPHKKPKPRPRREAPKPPTPPAPAPRIPPVGDSPGL